MNDSGGLANDAYQLVAAAIIVIIGGYIVIVLLAHLL
jgi:hypothetical protein